MSIINKLLFSISFALLLFGCAARPIQVSVRPNSHFNQNSTITIVRSANDTSEIHGLLEYALSSRGFNVISEAVSRKQIEYSEQTTKSEDQTSTFGSVAPVQRVESSYILRYNYKTRLDVPAGVVFQIFSASIVELQNGQVVVSAQFSQGDMSGMTIERVLNDFADRISASAKR